MTDENMYQIDYCYNSDQKWLERLTDNRSYNKNMFYRNSEDKKCAAPLQT